jgi:hypothetical protein
LLLRGHLLLDLTIIALHDGLGLTDLSGTCHLCTLHNNILLHKTLINVGIELFSLARRLHLLCYDTEAL